MKFEKMHGLGNDYIFIDNLDERELDIVPYIKKLCNRNTGIGSDGVVIMEKSDKADCFMRIYNADGSEAEMCGNAIRCVALYLYNKKGLKGPNLKIDTLSGIKDIFLNINNLTKEIETIRVNMGVPSFNGIDIGIDQTLNNYINKPIVVNGTTLEITALSMGNPHAVVFVDDINKVNINELGPGIENHAMFKNKTNVEFVEVVDRFKIRMRVWERGSGETLACGTGACASVVAAAATGRTIPSVDVYMKNGVLKVYWDFDCTKNVYLTGAANAVYTGKIKLKKLN